MKLQHKVVDLRIWIVKSSKRKRNTKKKKKTILATSWVYALYSEQRQRSDEKERQTDTFEIP